MSRRSDGTEPGKATSGQTSLTPSERFERRAERIARSAETTRHELSKPGDSQVGVPACADVYDAVPFGLRRRIPARFAIPEAGASCRECRAKTDDIDREQREIERVRRACLEAAQDLRSEIEAIDAELARVSSGGQQDLVHAEPAPVPGGKVMSEGSEGSF